MTESGTQREYRNGSVTGSQWATESVTGSQWATESVTGSQWVTESGILISLLIHLMFESGTGTLRLTELLTGLHLNLKIQMQSG